MLECVLTGCIKCAACIPLLCSLLHGRWCSSTFLRQVAEFVGTTTRCSSSKKICIQIVKFVANWYR
ncbi:unnamed protein product [Rhodiola kirilowii]